MLTGPSTKITNLGALKIVLGLKVWEDSVRATHLFLSDAEIKDIKQLYKKWGRMRSRLPIAFNVKIRV